MVTFNPPMRGEAVWEYVNDIAIYSSDGHKMGTANHYKSVSSGKFEAVVGWANAARYGDAFNGSPHDVRSSIEGKL